MTSNWRTLYQANENANNGNWYKISKVKFNYDEVVSYYPSADGTLMNVAPGFAFSPDGKKPVTVGTNLKWILRFKTSDMSFTQNGTITKYGANGVVYDSASYCEINGSEVKITWTTPVFFYCWANYNKAVNNNFVKGDLDIGADMAHHIYVLPEGMEEVTKTPAEKLTENLLRIKDAKVAIINSIKNMGVNMTNDTPIQNIPNYITQIGRADGNLAIALGNGKGQEWNARNTSPFNDKNERFDMSPNGGDYKLLFTCTQKIIRYSLKYNIGHTDGSTEYDVEPFTALIPTTTENLNNGLVNDSVLSKVLMFEFHIDEKPLDVHYREMYIRIWTDNGQDGSRQHDIILTQFN